MFFLRHILFKILLFSLPLFMAGCIDEDTPQHDPEIDNEHAILVLHIRALEENDAVNGEVTETVKSIRIIMIDENNQIECNQKVSQENLQQDTNDRDLYYFFRITTPGKKKFYLFANEETVENINDTGSSLTSFLEKYETGESSVTDFESKVNAIYFSPEYKIEEGEISLPYSSYYELDMQGGILYDQPMYLVPVATKICFNFFNNREYGVIVNGLGLSSVADKNFLMGQPAKTEQTKSYNGESLYWIDWLAKISEDSNEYPDFIPNVGFNEQNGWILNYSLPSTASHSEKKFIDAEDENDFIEIDEREGVIGGTPVPGKETLSYCYLPESRFFQNSNSLQQEYFLNINLEDKNPDVNKVEPVSVPLNNIKALFRNTRVIINVNFNEGTDEIYVEIRSWFSTDYFFGTVTKAQNL